MPSTHTAGSLWRSAYNELKNLFPEDVFDMWFSELSCSVETDTKMILTAKSEFNAIWIENNYLDIIHKQFCSFAGSAMEVTIEVATSDEVETADSGFSVRDHARTSQSSERSVQQSSTKRRSLINPTNTFDNFVVGSGCQLAHAASIAVANAPGRAYNPLFVFGETGLGKTHLMHAVAHQMLVNNPKARIAYISTEKFTNEFIHAIRENKLTKFRQYYRNVDALLVFDIHFLAGK
jgi:chromosomal replication initiator protein